MSDCLVHLSTYFVLDPCLFLHSVFLLFSFCLFCCCFVLFVLISFFPEQMLASSDHKGIAPLYKLSQSPGVV